MHAKSLQSCPTLCNPMDCSPPGSSVHGILQARILEWVPISLSTGSSQFSLVTQPCPTLSNPMDCSIPGFPVRHQLPELAPAHVHRVQLYDPLGWSPPGSSVHGISRQEHWNGLPFPLPGDLPDPAIKRSFLMSLALAGWFFTTSATWEAA